MTTALNPAIVVQSQGTDSDRAQDQLAATEGFRAAGG
jgi:hypothetical protein